MILILTFEINIEVHSLLDRLSNKWFIPQILGPTRVSEQTKPSLIGNIFINFTDLHCYSGKVLENISDHMLNFLIAQKLNVNIKQQQKPTIRDFNKFDSQKPAKEIDDLNLEEEIKNYSEINEKYDFFHKNIMEVMNNNTPIREQMVTLIHEGK